VIVGRVVGPLVATQKHKKFDGSTLLLVQPLGEGDTPRGPALLAVDTVGAGIHEKVLLVLDGRAAGDAMKKKAVPVDAAIVGIIDHIEIG
jgi:microcompartment protein CcmK/EutM